MVRGGLELNKSQMRVRLRKLAVIGAAGLILAACSSSGTNQVENTLDVQQGDQLAANQPTTPPIDAIQDPRAYCPKTVLRAGTETYDVYPQGVDREAPEARAQLQYRSTITEVARECNSAGSQLTMRIGIRGRYLSGPTGATGTFTMPVRVAVTQGDAVLYSQLHQIPAEIEPGTTNGTFSYIDNNVAFPMPERENIIVYVGFDEGPYDTP